MKMTRKKAKSKRQGKLRKQELQKRSLRLEKKDDDDEGIQTSLAMLVWLSSTSTSTLPLFSCLLLLFFLWLFSPCCKTPSLLPPLFSHSHSHSLSNSLSLPLQPVHFLLSNFYIPLSPSAQLKQAHSSRATTGFCFTSFQQPTVGKQEEGWRALTL